MQAKVETIEALLPSIKGNLQNAAVHAYKTLCHAQSQTLLHCGNYMRHAASSAHHTEQQHHILQAIEKCLKHQSEVDQAFAKELLAHFTLLAGQRPANINLSLMQTQQCSLHAEDDSQPRLLMDKIIADAQRQNTQALQSIHTVLEWSLPTVDVDATSNPFNPAVIANALYDALQLANIHSDAQVLIWKLYQRELFDKLGKFYQSVLHQFQQANDKDGY